MQGLQVIGLFLIQPVLWLSLIRSYVFGRQRIAYERRTFGSAIHAQNLETRRWWQGSLVWGLASSVITVVLGVMVDPGWALIYQAIMTISLILTPTLFSSVTLFVASWFVWQFLPTDWWQPWLTSHNVVSTSNWQVANQGLLLFTLLLAVIGALILINHDQFPSPQVLPDQRGKRIVRYRWRQLWLLPMLVVIPGDWLPQALSWWPVLGNGQHGVTFLLLPLLAGVNLQAMKELPQPAWHKLGQRLLLVAALTLIFFVVNLWLKLPAIWLMLASLVIVWLIVWQAKYHDQHQQFWFSDTDQGVRVISIRPNTPATKLNLGLGDIILEVNRQPVQNESEFYEALLINPTYCHLKVRNLQGNLIITETAIFTGAPHELGIVLFTDQEG